MKAEGSVFAVLGALDAFPQRLAAREIAARGGIVRRGLSRRTDIAVVGHRLAADWPGARIRARLDSARSLGARPISENALLGLLGLVRPPDGARDISGAALAERSGLDETTLDLLALFDGFDSCGEPYGFRDLVAARQYARMIGEGVDWLVLVRAVLSRGRTADGGISDVRLERTDWNAVAMRAGGALTELDGQHLLPLGCADDADMDRLFAEAGDAEEEGDLDRAVRLYRHCMAIDPGDPTIPFNLSHVLARQGDWREARHCLNRVLKLDPGYAEAWYNLAGLAGERNDRAAARRYLEKAIAADPSYPDPVYNLALLEYEEGRNAEAARLWTAYLELDPDSDWAAKARNGLRLIAMSAKGGAGALAPSGPRGLRPA